MAQSIQHDPAALILNYRPPIHSPFASAGSELLDAIVVIPLIQNIRQSVVGFPLTAHIICRWKHTAIRVSVLAAVWAGWYVAERRGHFLLADNAGIGEWRCYYLAACTQRLLW